MAKYFFHLRDGEELILDQEGADLPDLAAARKEAVLSAREIIAESISSAAPLDHLIVEIWDEKGPVEAVAMSVVLGENPSKTIH